MKSCVRSAGFLILLVSAQASGQPGPADRCVSREAVGAGPELAATPTGELLAWSQDGQGRIRDKTGHWTPLLRLAEPQVGEVVGDPEGFLLLRRARGGEVLLFDLAGTKRAAWTLDVGEGDVALASRSGRRWFLTNKALVPLLPRSALGAREPLPQSIASRVKPAVPFPPVPAPELLDDSNGAWLLCLPKSLFKEGYGVGVCERTGPGGWRVEDRLEGPVVLCGDWVVQTGENIVIVRSVQTGAVRASKQVDVAGQVTCAGPDRLAVGGKTVSILALPSLETMYRKKAEGGMIESMAYIGEGVAFTTERRSDIGLVSLPCAKGSRRAGRAHP